MPEYTVPIGKGSTLLLRYSGWIGRLKVYLNSQEVMKFGAMGRNQKLAWQGHAGSGEQA